jgi:hypothetical protein
MGKEDGHIKKKAILQFGTRLFPLHTTRGPFFSSKIIDLFSLETYI